MVLINKEIREPWLGWILNGEKTYEGRPKRGFWATLKKGDRFIAFNDQRNVTLEVTEILSFKDFGEAWSKLGTKLIPRGVMSPEDARKMYSEYYSEEDIDTLGVIAIGVSVV